MKSFVVILTTASAGLAAAQSLSNLPPCGQTCVSNMISIAESQFGCSVGNVTCYCTNKDFGYGVRDCSEQFCTSPQLAQSVIAFGLSYCASALSTASTTTGSVVPILSSASKTVTSTGHTGSTTSTATAPAKSSALAAATTGIAAVAGHTGVYLVDKSHTISVGGPVYSTDGVVYSAAKSDVLVDAHGASATVTPKVAASKTTVTSAIHTGATGGFVGAASDVASLSKNAYVVDGSHTISAGGKGFTTGGTAYTAATDGVIISLDGKSSTYKPTNKAMAASTITTATTKTTKTTSKVTPAASSSGSSTPSSSTTSGNAAAAVQTAVPGLIGAIALAILAL